MFYDSKKHKYQKIRAHIRHVALCVVMHLRTLTSHSVYSVHHQSKSDKLIQHRDNVLLCVCAGVIDTESPYECAAVAWKQY